MIVSDTGTLGGFDSGIGIWIPVGFVLLFGGLIYYAIRANRHRREWEMAHPEQAVKLREAELKAHAIGSLASVATAALD